MFKSGMERVALVVRHGIGFKVRLALDAVHLALVHLALVHLALKYKQALLSILAKLLDFGVACSQTSHRSTPHRVLSGLQSDGGRGCLHNQVRRHLHT